MLTIRHISCSGRETIVETKRIVTSDGSNDVYWENDDGTVTKYFDDGTLYVMNGMGKTVAVYHLSPTTVVIPDAEKR